MTDTDPDTRRLTELLSSFDTGRVPDLDLDRVARRGSRMRAARQLEAVLAVLTVVALAAGVLMFVGKAPAAPPSDSPAGPTRSAAPDPRVTGTAADWLSALERSMPYPDQIHHYDATGALFASTDAGTKLADMSHVYQAFRYTSGGRTTALGVSAWSEGNWDAILAGCRKYATACFPVQQTSVGPVVVTNASGHGIMAAMNRRPSGALIAVASFPYDVTSDGTDAIGRPAGLAGEVDKLVTIATLVPEPALAPATTPG